jgi:hypothetical protein
MPARLRHSIPEPPADPLKDSLALRNWMTAMTNHARTVQQSMTPPVAVPKPVVTPVAGGNVIDFERTDGDRYFLYHSTNPNRSNAAMVDIGLSSRYFDETASGAVAKTYWIVPVKGNMIGPPSRPSSGTSLALGTATNLPAPQPVSTTPTASNKGTPTSRTFPPIET